jgi:hypothetical protein
MLYEPENFDLRGVSAKGVHCDSPCSAIVSSLLVTLSSLSFDEMGPTKCDTVNSFPWVLEQRKPVIVVSHRAAASCLSAHTKQHYTQNRLFDNILRSSFLIWSLQWDGASPRSRRAQVSRTRSFTPHIQRVSIRKFLTWNRAVCIVPGQGGWLHAFVTVTSL